MPRKGLPAEAGRTEVIRFSTIVDEAYRELLPKLTVEPVNVRPLLRHLTYCQRTSVISKLHSNSSLQVTENRGARGLHPIYVSRIR